MIRKTDKQNEKGALIVEVIAVIALLGVMGPLLFRQVMSRNEEVDNINIATEVRTLKEGFAAYIMSNRGEIIENYPDGECHTVSADRIINFLPGGMMPLIIMNMNYVILTVFYKVLLPHNRWLCRKNWV